MNLIIRADATAGTGAGHVMRCANLAEAWRDARLGAVSLWGEVGLEFVQARLAGLGVRVIASPPAARDSVLVVDSYSESVRRQCLAVSARVSVLVDDLGDWLPDYDVVWNPNAYAAEFLYGGFGGTLLTQLVPLRGRLPRWEPESDRAGVVFGGGSQTNLLVSAVVSWRQRTRTNVVAPALGWTPPDWPSVAADGMWQELSRCAKLLTAAGSTVWEAAAVGIPACIIVTASNQEMIGNWAAAGGAPVLDAMRATDAEALAAGIEAGLERATVLPAVSNGSAAVVDALTRLAA